MRVIPKYVRVPPMSNKDSEFYIRNVPTTVQEFMQYAQAKGEYIYGGEDIREKKPNKPMTNISFVDMMNYCDWANCELPTAQQWMWAAGGGARRNTWAGTSILEELKIYAHFGELSRRKPHRVGKLMPNEYGLYDMSGNIWEVTQTKPEGNAFSVFAFGGSWYNDASIAKVTSIMEFDILSGYSKFVGFRTIYKPDFNFLK